MKSLLAATAAAAAILISTASFANPNRTAEVNAYEECAQRVFAQSKEVSDVFRRCAREMNAYLRRLDPEVRNEIEQRTEAATRRALTNSIPTQVNEEDGS